VLTILLLLLLLFLLNMSVFLVSRLAAFIYRRHLLDELPLLPPLLELLLLLYFLLPLKEQLLQLKHLLHLPVHQHRDPMRLRIAQLQFDLLFVVLLESSQGLFEVLLAFLDRLQLTKFYLWLQTLQFIFVHLIYI
jgi:hypothetical protein